MSSAREAADALRRVVSRAREDATEGEPSAEAIDELARLAGVLGRTVDMVAGEDGGAVRQRAAELATAIAAHRDQRTR
ncbi:MAG TPA: hypothetical protein VGH76_07620 [Actinomycetospora sp.]|uniref:hypothetical protein n=1 Tax=Actinomycetospora sp. TaxID=1872135 RepID=UPI002F42D74F